MDDPRIATFKQEAQKVLEHLRGEFAKLQTGRASAAFVENVSVDAYGQRQPLKTLAGITVQDARSIVIQPWDRGILREVEIALQNANLGAMPASDGSVIRINLPPMTEERRKQLVKLVDKFAEEARISVRQNRQEVHDALKSQEKDEDARYTLLEILQKAVEETNAKIEEMKERKETEIMTV